MEPVRNRTEIEMRIFLDNRGLCRRLSVFRQSQHVPSSMYQDITQLSHNCHISNSSADKTPTLQTKLASKSAALTRDNVVMFQGLLTSFRVDMQNCQQNARGGKADIFLLWIISHLLFVCSRPGDDLDSDVDFSRNEACEPPYLEAYLGRQVKEASESVDIVQRQSG